MGDFWQTQSHKVAMLTRKHRMISWNDVSVGQGDLSAVNTNNTDLLSIHFLEDQ